MKKIKRSLFVLMILISQNLWANDNQSSPTQVRAGEGYDRSRQNSETINQGAIAPGQPIRLENLSDLRNGAQNLLNKLSSNIQNPWTDPSLVRNVTIIKAAHIDEIRRSVKQFYREYCAPEPIFTDDPLVPGYTPVKAVHFKELKEKIDQAPADSLCSPPTEMGSSDCSAESGGARVCWGSGANMRCKKMARNYQCP